MKKRRVKRRLKVGRLILVIVLGIGLAISTYFGIRYLLKSSNDKSINKPSKEEKEKVYTASVITAGDNLIHSSIYKDANKNANYNGYDFKPMYELIKPIVSKYDIKYYNQETGAINWTEKNEFADIPMDEVLQPGTDQRPYSVFEVVEPINVKSGSIASWFDEPGGGIQYLLPDTVDELLDAGILRRIQ